MRRQHYLLKVLGLSAVPKLVTFALTLVAFPLMVRAVGPAEYGVVVYFTSVIVLFDALSAGVTAATGKAVASARVLTPTAINAVLVRWGRLLALVSVGGLLVAAVGGGLFIRWSGYDSRSLELYVLLALGSWFAIGATFIKVAMTSLLQFTRVAVLDTLESVLRSASWLVVAWAYPTAAGLAVSALIVAAIVLVLSLLSLWRTPRVVRATDVPSGTPVAPVATGTREMAAESMQFFGVSLATRAFQALPLIVIDRLLGSEVVGVLGAFGRVIELVSLPLAIVANAMAVRAQEVLVRGREAMERYWNVIVRTAVIACVGACAFWLVAEDVARLMMPQSSSAATLFRWMVLLLAARAVSDLFVPASDYIGGLGRRVVFLGSCAVLQVPVIWFGAAEFGELGAVLGVVAAYTITVAGYIAIARRAFFGPDPAHLPPDVPLALAVAVLGMLISGALTSRIDEWLAGAQLPLAPSTAALILYLAAVGGAFMAVPGLRRVYPTLRFLELD